MPISIKMPALSPTMEHGTLAKWLVKEGDKVEPGDIIAEIETDKATMEFEVVDEGTVAKILIPAGTEGVKVGTDIAMLTGEGEDAGDVEASAPAEEKPEPEQDAAAEEPEKEEKPVEADTITAEPKAAPKEDGGRIKASPLARRLAAEKGVDLSALGGSGPHGRIVKADVDAAEGGQVVAGGAKASAAPAEKAAPVEMAAETRAILDERIPHDVEKLSGMRKTIAKRLTQSMQQAPHIYLTVDIRLDRLLALRSELNSALTGKGVKLSVNDMLIKALALALIEVPQCNVAFAGNELIRYSRADISVAVSIPGGLITPIVQDASGRSLSEISSTMLELGQRAKKGKLQPNEYQGGTASISNMGMMGIKHFTAVINPPQSTIVAIGAGEQRAIVEDGKVVIANMMTATGSFDHRAVDGADGARLMAAFKAICEAPGRMVI